MSRFAYYLARSIWILMLWFMRRPFMRKMRRRSWEWWPEPARSRIRRSIILQDRWALRHGLKILNVMTAILTACVVLWVVLTVCLQLYEAGVLSVPDSVQNAERPLGAK